MEQDKLIGRIDFLFSGGRVGESVKYTDPEKFERAVKENNYFGVPMIIVFYRDKEGKCISDKFLSSLDPPPQGIKYINCPE